MTDSKTDSIRRTRLTASILVASDAHANASVVSELLAEEFDGVRASWVPESAVSDYDAHRPQVLVLAFEELEKAEIYYLGLYRHSRAISVQPHRTVILCHKDDVKRVFELCRTEHFDDYILFWPMSYDGYRVPMAVYSALRHLAASERAPGYPREIVDSARHLSSIGEFLDERLAAGAQHIETIRSAAERVGKGGNAGADVRAITDAVAPASRWMDQLHADAAPYVQAAESMRPVAQQKLHRILIVDDDAFQRELLAKYLRGQPCELVFAADSSEAFALAMAERPDLILMDIVLPDVDGLEATRRIRALPNLARVPVIVLTGKFGREAMPDSQRAGATDFLVKPVDRGVLVGKVREYLAAAKPKTG
jgi:CheY-like chemotaxis protein